MSDLAESLSTPSTKNGERVLNGALTHACLCHTIVAVLVPAVEVLSIHGKNYQEEDVDRLLPFESHACPFYLELDPDAVQSPSLAIQW